MDLQDLQDRTAELLGLVRTNAPDPGQFGLVAWWGGRDGSQTFVTQD